MLRVIISQNQHIINLSRLIANGKKIDSDESMDKLLDNLKLSEEMLNQTLSKL